MRTEFILGCLSLLLFLVTSGTSEGTARITTLRPPCTTTTTTRPPTVGNCPSCTYSSCPDEFSRLHLPYPGDCTKFCQCDNMETVAMTCPDGLYFNKNIMVCDWPSAAGCTIDNTYQGSCTKP